jgi:Transcriptional regulator, AbiEi antitoxin, Type IV TA system
VKRLFLWYADRHEHAWLKHLDQSSVDLGKGKRQLVPQGHFDSHYQITLPTELFATGGSSNAQ